MIYFVGAGSGAPDLITVRGAKLLGEADVIVYAGSLVNPALLDYAKPDCAIYDSAKMTLEEVIDVMAPAAREGKTVVRLHTGDPCVYGAHREQMDALDRLGHTRSAPAFLRSAARRRRSGRNIPCRTSARRSF